MREEAEQQVVWPQGRQILSHPAAVGMRELAHLPELENSSKVFLENIERPRGLYLCWQEPSRLGCAKVDGPAVGTPQYLKFTAVCEVKALSKYLFAASNNCVFFWAPENLQTSPSSFIELSRAAKIVSFAFHNGRFLLLWTLDSQRKVFVTLTSKKAQVLAQREISTLAVYDLDFLEFPQPPFLIGTVAGRAWVTLSDGSLWTALLEEDSLAEFARVANLHSPAVWISQRADSLHIISCLGRSYSVSGSLELHERSCVAPVLRVFHLEDAALAVTSSDSYVLKFDDDGFSTVDRSKWHGILAVAKEQGDSNDLICVFRSGKICACRRDNFFRISSPDKDNSNSDPWGKLEKLADLRESRALAQVGIMNAVQRQIALLMYLKFKALAVQCNIKQHFYPSLIEDHVVTCELKAEEVFDSSMWIACVVLRPHGRDVSMTTSAPFNHRGTSITLQFEYPRSLLLSLRVFLSIKSRFIPRNLSLMIHEQEVCSGNGVCEIPSTGFLVHRPSIECSVARDLLSFLRSIVGDEQPYSANDVGSTKLTRIVLQKANRKQILSLRAVVVRMLTRNRSSLEPKFLVPKSMEQTVQATKEQLLSCESMKALVTCYEQWRNFTMKLPLL